MHGLVIAGTHSGCGKTTVTLGLLAALKKKGLKVQAFKTGPDFIDSGLHRMITGRPSRNLDLWMCGKDYVSDCFSRNSRDADISVIEGVMGLYDGAESTATLAARLCLPVVLVIDAYGMAETAGAVVKGFAEYGRKNKAGLAGVILNRVASENHYRRLLAGISGVTVFGYLPREVEFGIPQRHLGLTVAEEDPIAKGNIDKLADAVLRHIDVDAIVELKRQSSDEGITDTDADETAAGGLSLPDSRTSAPARSPITAVAYDRAFCFYYEDNLDLLKDAGAEIVRFSPLSDASLPEGTEAVYIGGGYPELYARELSVNRSMLGALNSWAASGKPLYAECGGLMYLSRGIHDFEGNFFGMAEIFPFETRMKKGRSRLGYREVSLREDCVLGKKGAALRGHEFHYSEVVTAPDRASAVSAAYCVRDGSGRELDDEGYLYKRALASYIHIHFGSNPDIAERFIGACSGER
jgi:cobyrinic acid a,c-diamide synthase